jgi:hypothetical protein
MGIESGLQSAETETKMTNGMQLIVVQRNRVGIRNADSLS